MMHFIFIFIITHTKIVLTYNLCILKLNENIKHLYYRNKCIGRYRT